MSEPTDRSRAADDEGGALFEAREEASVGAARPDGSDGRDADDAGDKRPTVVRRGGRLLASIALLAALAALGGTGYLYYRLERANPLTPLVKRIDSIEAQYRQLDGTIAALKTDRDASLAEFKKQQEQALAKAEEGFSESLSQLARQAPPSSREWKVAEVAYLLRIANHRLLMERDAQGALSLLHAADEILSELDDFAFYQVRAQLASEMLALSSLEQIDLAGIYLELEAVKDDVARLPLKLPDYLAARQLPAAPATTDMGFWETLGSELAGYFRIRRVDGDIKPLLPPDESVYLELNLRLMLEQAQLAALRRQQVVFTQSLSSAADWLAEYLDPEDPQVIRMTDKLRNIAATTLDEPLPDISGSLTALTRVRSES